MHTWMAVVIHSVFSLAMEVRSARDLPSLGNSTENVFTEWMSPPAWWLELCQMLCSWLGPCSFDQILDHLIRLSFWFMVVSVWWSLSDPISPLASMVCIESSLVLGFSSQSPIKQTTLSWHSVVGMSFEDVFLRLGSFVYRNSGCSFIVRMPSIAGMSRNFYFWNNAHSCHGEYVSWIFS